MILQVDAVPRVGLPVVLVEEVETMDLRRLFHLAVSYAVTVVDLEL
jgi:hypothetical protein